MTAGLLLVGGLLMGCEPGARPNTWYGNQLPAPTPLDVVESIRQSEPTSLLCGYHFILEPELLVDYPGYFANAVGCHTGPTWHVTPAPDEWYVYARPYDISIGNPDPERKGNYLQILSPGVYWVEVEFEAEAYGAAAVRVVVP